MGKLLTTENFIEKSNIIHNYKYNYELTVYKNATSKVLIICNKHGVFKQTPVCHMNSGGCRKCGIEKRTEGKTSNIKEFIIKSKKVHGEKYDYSNVIYVNNFTKVKIKCIKHQTYFNQAPNSHLVGRGCPLCGLEKQQTCHPKQLTTEIFLTRSREIHGDRYDYSLVEYISQRKKVDIICKIHGVFKQLPDAHFSVNQSGCPKCNSSKGEIKIRNFLEKHNIKFEEQKKFEKCRLDRKLPFDFFLTDYNILIEFNGMQHYKQSDFFHKTWSLEKCQERDNVKRKFAKDNNIKLLEIPYWKRKNIESILTKELNLEN